MPWIDTHCHLDAIEFDHDSVSMWERARKAGVTMCVLPSVSVANLAKVRDLAHQYGYGYAFGIHPFFVRHSTVESLEQLCVEMGAHLNDLRLIAVGEIGLDFFLPELCTPDMRTKQEQFYRAQLQLARKHDLPVVLHVRRSADRLLKHLRDIAGPGGRWQGIAHAFSGSLQQAEGFIALGFKLGFGGAVTFDRALQLRALVKQLPLHALVLETDAPDMPPHWIYVTQAERAAGVPQGRNEPAELPRIGAVVADLRGMPVAELAAATTANALAALPRLRALLPNAAAPC